ncbi:MAG: 3'-5' exonuclease [Clostridia bacterium]|nr:3'-5' exonuclease [Clostridia bacterium]
MDFTAIDFETATSKFTSACSLGWCVVENNKIVEREEILIRPEPFEFNKYNVRIHGIKPDMVEDKPTFDMYWDSIRDRIENRTVIAHNASFDVRVLCATLAGYGIELPEFKYLCTVRLSQKAYPELESHKLNNLCDALGISFRHHRAFDDAYACAMAFLRIAEDYSLETIAEIEECFDMPSGEIYPGIDLSPKHRRRSHRKSAHKHALVTNL